MKNKMEEFEMKHSRRLISLLLSGCMFTTALAGCGGTSPTPSPSTSSLAVSGSSEAAPAKLEEFITMGTSSSGGTFNTLGVAICQLLSEKISETSFSAEVTGGSSENCARIQNGELQIAFSAASSAYEAFHGIGQFEGNQASDLYAIANLYPAIMQLPVLKSSGIQTLDDISGHKVNIGPAGSGSEAQVLAILESYGISTDSFNVQQLSHSNASDALMDEKLDGYIISGSLGQSHQMKAMSSGKAMMASFLPQKKIDKLIADYPYYYTYNIPANTYPNQPEGVPTVATGTLLIVRGNISEELVYQITKNLFEGVEVLAQGQAIAKEIKLDSALNCSGVELHPGAVRYYKEVGVL